MRAELLVVPYVLGREGAGMGAGPLALERDVAEILRPERTTRLALSAPFGNEVGACFDLNRQLAAAVTETTLRGALPVVLTGSCHSQQAVVAGLRRDGLGLVWLDCHSDFHTPESTETGFFDGCALAMTVGDCWTALCATVPGFKALPADQVTLVGARGADGAERARLDASAVTQVAAADVDGLPDALPFADRLSVHVDLDVLDAAHGRANAYAAPGGITPAQLTRAVRECADHAPVAALTLSAYDPSYDDDGAVHRAALDVVGVVAAAT
jgi:arginase